MRSLRRCLAASACCLALASCTVVRITGPSQVETKLYPGIANVHVTSPADSVAVVSTHGLGLVLAPQSGTLGWVREQVVRVPPSARCQIILIEATAEQAAEVLALMARAGRGAEGICSIKTEKE
jgi:hypothetical protein